jgi:hypothetical protein
MINNLYDLSTPLTAITDREIDTTILKAGSFLSIISSKKVNQSKLLISVIENEDFRQLFLALIDIDDVQQLVRCIIDKYPSISKSKIVTKSLRKK